MKRAITYIDLFAGAGGLSEGFYKSGYKPFAHVEMDAAACKTLKTRSAFYYLLENSKKEVYENYLEGKITQQQLYDAVPSEILKSVIQAEVSDDTMPEIFSQIDQLKGDQEIDLIIGGPPCQAYSIVGRSRIGRDNVLSDKRYHLYKHYAEFLKRYKPQMFVFENVQGLLSVEGGELLRLMKNVLEECGYRISYKLLNSADYGVLQERKRLILIGRKGHFDLEYPVFEKWSGKQWSVKDALFSDLPALKQGEEIVLARYKTKLPNDYLATTHIRNGAAFATQHVTRPHNDRDLEIYSIAIRKWLVDGERLEYSDLPANLKTHKNETDFGDRFKVINPSGNSHTVVAHLAKDGHHFIYPDENNPRSISVREAARIQSFPDDFFFEGGRNSAFRQIGNAVPPLMAEAIAKKIEQFF
jgi:DNA (cytosine-5)-methyltransferase 1